MNVHGHLLEQKEIDVHWYCLRNLSKAHSEADKSIERAAD